MDGRGHYDGSFQLQGFDARPVVLTPFDTRRCDWCTSRRVFVPRLTLYVQTFIPNVGYQRGALYFGTGALRNPRVAGVQRRAGVMRFETYPAACWLNRVLAALPPVRTPLGVPTSVPVSKSLPVRAKLLPGTGARMGGFGGFEDPGAGRARGGGGREVY